MSKDYEILTIGDDDEPAVLGAGLGAAPDANCSTLPDGSCVAPDPCMHTPDTLNEPRKVAVIGNGAAASLSLLAAAAAASPQIQRLAEDRQADDARPFIPFAPTTFEEVPTPEGVEYEIQMPGGGTETVKAGQLEGEADTYLKAKRHLQKLEMLKVLMKRQRRRLKLEEAKPNRVEKSRKKRDAQKASRKKNRGK